MKELLQLANIPRSTYYYWIRQFNRLDPNAEVKELIQTIYDEHNGCYGYRRIRDELMNREYKVNHKKVYRLMKELGLKCLVLIKNITLTKGPLGKLHRLF
ncbi:IS3 family transposase [Bacillus cereus]|uniref:IS3 family transposase n=1 Tax=Bacillus cereus TaxID=1396 RepID=UPI0020D28A3C|nr:IS3 family transposase [Bacillus cereus]